MKVAIVEDEIIVADHLENILLKNGYKPVALAENIVEANEAIAQKPDLFLLDIRLSNDDNGIDFAATLSEKKIPFIYITANNEMEVMKVAIQTKPETYITKPFKEGDVIAALELVKLKLNSVKFINILTKKGEERLLESDIRYCEADGVYTMIHTIKNEIIQRIKLKDLEVKLSDDFIRVHRSYVVNKTKISSKKASSVYIENVEIPVSRSYKKDVSELI